MRMILNRQAFQLLWPVTIDISSFSIDFVSEVVLILGLFVLLSALVLAMDVSAVSLVGTSILLLIAVYSKLLGVYRFSVG